MEADDFQELKFLLKSAGVPVDQALGLGVDSDEEEDEPIPSPHTFKENIKAFFGKDLESLMPDITEFELYGTKELEENEKLIMPPPSIDIEHLMQPILLTPEMERDVEKMRTKYETGSQNTKGTASETTEKWTTEEPPSRTSLSPSSSTPEMAASLPGEESHLSSRKPSKKRPRRDTASTTPELEVMEDEPTIVIDSSNSSMEEEENTSVVDLTQT